MNWTLWLNQLHRPDLYYLLVTEGVTLMKDTAKKTTQLKQVRHFASIEVVKFRINLETIYKYDNFVQLAPAAQYPHILPLS